MTELTEQQKQKRQELVQQRGQIKARMTRLRNYMESAGVYASAEHVNKNLLKLDEELQKLANIEISLIEIEPTGNHAEETENIMFDYEDMMVLIRKFREPHREAEITRQTPPSPNPESTASFTTPAKLPFLPT